MSVIKKDIAIVGAGVSGLALCLALQEDFQVALIDPIEPQTTWPKDKPALRQSALNLSSKALFEKLGVWDSIMDYHHGRYRSMHVWDHISGADITMDASEVAESYLGYIIENRVLCAALWQHITAKSIEHPCYGVFGSKLDSITKVGECWQLTTQDGVQIEAPLVVAADGARSWLRQELNFTSVSGSYEQSALVALVEHQKPHAQCASQVFLPEGPLAFLPQHDPHYSSIVWTMEPEQAQRHLELSNDDFNQALSQAFSAQLGACKLVGEKHSRGVFPLHYHHAKCYFKDQVVLLADAGHQIHPLAGQGMNLGLADVAALALQLQKAKAKKRPFYTDHVLRGYQQQRYKHNQTTLMAMNTFKKLFSNDHAPSVLLRSFGLKSANKLGFIKRYCIKQALYGQD